MKRNPAIASLLAMGVVASLDTAAAVGNAPKRKGTPIPKLVRRRARYYLDIPMRAEGYGGARQLPPPAATPQPGPVKGTRKLSRAERKLMKARRA